MITYTNRAILDTEVRILQSDLMALQVIRQLNLDKRPEFGGHADQKQANLVADPLQDRFGASFVAAGNLPCEAPRRSDSQHPDHRDSLQQHRSATGLNRGKYSGFHLR